MDNGSQQVLADLLQELNAPGGDTEEVVAEATGILPSDEVLELGDSFSLDRFQVVRREFFAHLREPSATFNNCKFAVNASCIAKFPNTDYVQVLINQESKVMALRPCEEGARDSFMWCGYSKGKRKTKPITCKLFFAKVVDMMGWNPNYRYKLLGKLIHANGEYLITFDLTATEVYQRTVEEGKKPKNSRTPVFPAGWQDQFGLPYSEHKQSMQINIFDGYAIYSLKEPTPGESNAGAAKTEQMPLTAASMNQ